MPSESDVQLFSDRKVKTPQETLTAYSELVNQRAYDQMYEMVSEETKERISKEEFTKRNQKIYEGSKRKNNSSM